MKRKKRKADKDIELLVERAQTDGYYGAPGPDAQGRETAGPATEDDEDTAPADGAADGTHAAGGQADRVNRSMQALRDLTSDEDEPAHPRTPITAASILGGDILGGGWFRKQFLFIVMCVGMLLVYVSNRYACQREMITHKQLTDTLLDRRYKALTRSAQLKEKTRRSFIEESLTDSTLQTANTPSFNLKVDE